MSHATTPNLGMQDFFSTTLNGNVTSSSTAFPLNALPTASEGFLVIDPNNVSTREVIYFNTSGSGSVNTPDATQGSGRGLGGTTVQAHTTGTLVEMREVAEYWEALQNGDSLGTGSVTTNALATGIEPVTVSTNPYKFYYGRVGSFNVGNNTPGLVTFDTQVFDTGSNYSTSTGKFTAPVNGFYWFNTVINASTDTYLLVQFNKNGSLALNGTEISSGGGSSAAGLSGILQLSAGDYVQVLASSLHGASGGTAVTTTYFQGFLVSAT